ncbi:MAG: aldo/keto reductase [Anaerolineae bacterium]|nr:aldo/keto reductase [Anaerolineae bacterium]
MKYCQLGRTGVMVSQFCLGTMDFGGKSDEREAAAVINRALDAGINFFDTANCYNRGISEEIVGNVFKRNGQRARIVLATKVHVRMDDTDPNAFGNHRRHIIEQCHASLRRLQTDWIDVYYIHRAMSTIPIDETLRALDDLVHAGKVHYIGCSNFASWQILESLWTSKDYGLNRFVVEQPPYHLLDRSIERELIPMAQTYGIALAPWSPLAGGLLTGKYTRGSVQQPGWRIQPGNPWGDRHLTDAALDAVSALHTLAADKGCTLSQLALAWVAAQPGITSPILGARTLVYLEDALGAFDVNLTPDDMAQIDTIVPPGSITVPYYYIDGAADFGPARYRW